MKSLRSNFSITLGQSGLESRLQAALRRKPPKEIVWLSAASRSDE